MLQWAGIVADPNGRRPGRQQAVHQGTAVGHHDDAEGPDRHVLDEGGQIGAERSGIALGQTDVGLVQDQDVIVLPLPACTDARQDRLDRTPPRRFPLLVPE